MAGLKFADSHNVAIILADPPASHAEFRSMMHGLRECRLATTLTVNPTIFQRLIKEFWSFVEVVKGDDGVISIQATVNKCKVIIDGF